MMVVGGAGLGLVVQASYQVPLKAQQPPLQKCPKGMYKRRQESRAL